MAAVDICRDDMVQRFLAYSKAVFPDASSVHMLDQQGACSVTILVQHQGTSFILQFRPLRFRVDLSMMQAARSVHYGLVPDVFLQDLCSSNGYQILGMDLLNGVPASRLLPRSHSLDATSFTKLSKVMEDLADVFASSWKLSVSRDCCIGVVGRSIRARLVQLSIELPTHGLRRLAHQVLWSVDKDHLEPLPVVLTHGDLLPSNILCNLATGKLTGLIDWAEAEYLPFGLSLYGIDHLLGYQGATFVYYEQACVLKNIFWTRLLESIPALVNKDLRASVDLARTTGILLWHGFAWDHGKIDRVVNPLHDTTELNLLKTMLAVELDAMPSL